MHAAVRVMIAVSSSAGAWLCAWWTQAGVGAIRQWSVACVAGHPWVVVVSVAAPEFDGGLGKYTIVGDGEVVVQGCSVEGEVLVDEVDSGLFLGSEPDGGCGFVCDHVNGEAVFGGGVVARVSDDEESHATCGVAPELKVRGSSEALSRVRRSESGAFVVKGEADGVQTESCGRLEGDFARSRGVRDGECGGAVDCADVDDEDVLGVGGGQVRGGGCGVQRGKGVMAVKRVRIGAR